MLSSNLRILSLNSLSSSLFFFSISLYLVSFYAFWVSFSSVMALTSFYSWSFSASSCCICFKYCSIFSWASARWFLSFPWPPLNLSLRFLFSFSIAFNLRSIYSNLILRSRFLISMGTSSTSAGIKIFFSS